MIVVPAGYGELSDGPVVTGPEALAPGSRHFDPPDTSRSDAGARVDAAVKLLAAHVESYRKAVLAQNGELHVDARVALNVKASIRRNSPALAALLGLS